MDKTLIEKYNYDEFVPANFMPWMRFGESPALGEKGPDFPLWQEANGQETSLSAVWSSNLFTIVEFGSFT